MVYAFCLNTIKVGTYRHKFACLALGVVAYMLASCSSYKLPPFASSPQWSLEGNVASSEVCGMAINFGGETVFPISNASDGDYDLNFITSASQFAVYDSFCREYITSALKRIPVGIDSIEFVLADRYIVLSPAIADSWMPDFIRRGDGAEIVVEANPISSTVQPHDEIWRNFLFDDHLRRVIIVDRLVKNGRHHAIVYILQSENKRVPFTTAIHFDITSRRNIQFAGEMMRALFDISIKARDSKVRPHSYSDYIRRADSCFMAGDYVGASRQFDKAFAGTGDIPGSHLYNAACAASLAGLNDLAFARLNKRLEREPSWYVDDPFADNDLANLHSDPRWIAYADTVIARRDRIEANYDKALRSRLQEIGRSDQAIRYEFLKEYNNASRNQAVIDSLITEMQRIDNINQTAISEILDTKGFAGSDKVGDACAVFWLIIQHSPVEMQKRYFPLFEEAAIRGDLSKENVAMMDDRIALFEGRPQKYGSQIVEGKLHTLLDPTKVDQWRREVGMPPLDEYLRQMGATR